MLSTMKTVLYFSDSIVRARLIAGECLTSSDVPDEELASEIDEGGGCVWFCGFCRVVHSPNRPGACDDDGPLPVGFQSSIAALEAHEEWEATVKATDEEAPLSYREMLENEWDDRIRAANR